MRCWFWPSGIHASVQSPCARTLNRADLCNHWEVAGAVRLLRLRHKRYCGYRLALLDHWFWGRPDTVLWRRTLVALRRDPSCEELRPPADSQHWPVSNASEPFRNWILQTQSSLQVTAALAVIMACNLMSPWARIMQLSSSQIPDAEKLWNKCQLLF